MGIELLFTQLQYFSHHPSPQENYSQLRNFGMNCFDFGQNQCEIIPVSHNGKLVIGEYESVSPDLFDIILRIAAIATVIIPLIVISIRLFYLSQNEFVYNNDVLTTLQNTLSQKNNQIIKLEKVSQSQFMHKFGLPWEIFRQILSYLSPSDGLKLAQVEKFLSTCLQPNTDHFNFVQKCIKLTETHEKAHIEAIVTLADFDLNRAISTSSPHLNVIYKNYGRIKLLNFFYKAFESYLNKFVGIDETIPSYNEMISSYYEMKKPCVKEYLLARAEKILGYVPAAGMIGHSQIPNPFALVEILVELKNMNEDVAYEDLFFRSCELIKNNKNNNHFGLIITSVETLIYGFVVALAPCDVSKALFLLSLLDEMKLIAIENIIEFLNLEDLTQMYKYIIQSEQYPIIKSMILAKIIVAFHRYNKIEDANAAKMMLFKIIPISLDIYSKDNNLLETDSPILEELFTSESSFFETLFESDYGINVINLNQLYLDHGVGTQTGRMANENERHHTEILRYGLTLRKIISTLMPIFPQDAKKIINLIKENYQKNTIENHITLQLATAKALVSFEPEYAQQIASKAFNFTFFHGDLFEKLGQIYGEISPHYALAFAEAISFGKLHPDEDNNIEYYQYTSLAIALKKIRDNGLVHLTRVSDINH